MPVVLRRWLGRGLWALALIVLTVFAVRVFDASRGPPLQPWHTYVPHELSAAEIARSDWPGYVRAEDALFRAVRARMRQTLPPRARVPANRYFEGSPVFPGRYAHDWNRSYVLEPAGAPLGAVVLLHGLTDAPYSLRHVAEDFRRRGFVAIGPRLPAHGTVPAALTRVDWETWMAATHLAVREARRRVGPGKPLHLVGYSNGGALAVMYALDAGEDPRLARPDRLVLISPMIGLTRFARYAGLAALPAVFPAFAKAAWLDLLPEFNPFKYNSFPVNGARQSHRLATALQDRVRRAARAGQLGALPPILTFQSVVDFTVSTPAVLTGLYAQLPANGSELVLFDVNRNLEFGPLLRDSADRALTQLLPVGPQRYRVSVIANAEGMRSDMVERSIAPGQTQAVVRPLALTYPREMFSLSHVALPFPTSDGLYGLTPAAGEDFGLQLGAIAPRGERSVLVVNGDFLLRVTSNPFFPYLLERIAEGSGDSAMLSAPAPRPSPRR